MRNRSTLGRRVELLVGILLLISLPYAAGSPGKQIARDNHNLQGDVEDAGEQHQHMGGDCLAAQSDSDDYELSADEDHDGYANEDDASHFEWCPPGGASCSSDPVALRRRGGRPPTHEVDEGAFVAACIDGLSVQELATEFGVTEDIVKKLRKKWCCQCDRTKSVDSASLPDRDAHWLPCGKSNQGSRSCL